MTRKQIEAAADRAGWNCIIKRSDDGKMWDVYFNMNTTCNQDVEFGYTVKTLDKIVDEVYDSWQGYDPDEEAILWYKGRGAPSSLRDLLNDMDEVDDALERLYTTLNGGKLPEEKPVSYAEKANDLRRECLMELTSFSHNVRPSKFGYDAKGYDNPDMCSKYEEIIYLYDRWVLIDGDSNQYNVEVMPLEEFCEMVDAIIGRKE